MDETTHSKIKTLIKSMRDSGRYDAAAAHYMERELLKAYCEYERILRELWSAEYRLESSARGLVNWSQEAQFQRNESGEIIGGYRAHPNYAEIWNQPQQKDGE